MRRRKPKPEENDFDPRSLIEIMAHRKRGLK